MRRRKQKAEVLPECDFKKKAVRGKYAKEFAGQRVIAVVLDPDVAQVFPDAKSVKEILRACQVMMNSLPQRKARRRRAG